MSQQKLSFSRWFVAPFWCKNLEIFRLLFKEVCVASRIEALYFPCAEKKQTGGTDVNLYRKYCFSFYWCMLGNNPACMTLNISDMCQHVLNVFSVNLAVCRTFFKTRKVFQVIQRDFFFFRIGVP